MVTLNQFAAMIPTNKEPAAWHELAMPLFKKYNIDTINRIAGFMAQCGHESGDFKTIQENLNYSAERLRQIFPRYFKSAAEAQRYHRQPEAIANVVYNDANRTSKLGNTQPGDGWRFRGRGLIQLTGRWNYTKFAESLDMTAEEAAAYCETKKGAFESACWFWSVNNLNRFSDKNDINGMSKAVNGGTHGLADRVARYNRARGILNATSTPTQISEQTIQPLQVGSKGALVKKVQQKLKIAADGDFGPGTKRAVENWQSINNFNKTGILTPDQIKRLLNVT